MGDALKPRSLKRKNVKGLALNPTGPKLNAKPSDGDAQIPGAIGNADSERTDTLEIGLEFKLDLRSEDLVVLKELGAGNGGTVSKVMHASTKVVMARKIIRVDAKEKVRKQIVRELQVGHDCNSPNIVIFYGAFQNEARDIVLCMEYMDCGSLDRIAKDFGPVRVDVLGKIAESILSGLVYLYEAHRIMHRDIKPSNVLVNSRGHIKLCDFGVATETVNSIADTFVGTSTYMAPERIQGSPYSVRSDVWSMGLTIMELAIGRFPFDSTDSAAGNRASAGPMGILDLLQQIVHEPAPKLPKSDAFPAILEQFIDKCLLKKPEERPTPRELFDKDAFLQAAKRTPVNLREWAISMMEQHNRKSYLAPPPPKAINRDGSRDSVSSYQEQSEKSNNNNNKSPRPPPPPSRHSKPQTPRLQQSQQQRATPTSGEIPVNFSRDAETTPRGRIQVETPGSSLGLEHLTMKEQRPKPSRNPSSYSSTNGSNSSTTSGSCARSGPTTATTSPQPQHPSSAHHTNSNSNTNNTSDSANMNRSPVDTPQYSARSAPSPYLSKSRVGSESAGYPTSAGGRPPPPPTGPLPAPPPRSAGTSGWRGKEPQTQAQGQAHRQGGVS